MANASAQDLARRRWDAPDAVARRVDAVAARIEQTLRTVPESDPNREKLARALMALQR